MKRKLSKIGQSSLLVSLPHQWIKEHNLKKGDEVEVELSDGDILIHTGKKQRYEKKERTITLLEGSSKKLIRIYLNTLYRMGYDRIIVKYQDKKTIDVIRYIVVNYLLGFEIIREEEDRCVIESLTEPTVEKASVLLRKIFFIIDESLNILIDDMKAGIYERLKSLEELMIRCDRFCNFYSRTLMREKQLNPFVWTMVQKLLMTQHCIYYCYKTIAVEDYQKYHQKFIHYVMDAKKLFQLLTTVYYKKDLRCFENGIKLKEELLHNRLTQIQKTKESGILAAHLFAMVKIMPTLGGSMLNESYEEIIV